VTQKADIAFASFHFQLTQAAPDEFTGADYLQWIEDALGAIATVTEIEISAEQTYRRCEFERPDAAELQFLTDLHYNIPRLQFVTIAFYIHIPRRTDRTWVWHRSGARRRFLIGAIRRLEDQPRNGEASQWHRTGRL
jgi:hypothetical protein